MIIMKSVHRPEPFFLLLLFSLCCLDLSNGLCALDKGNTARCHALEDVKHIDAYDLHTLRAVPMQKHLNPGTFRNFMSLKHLDLSKGNLKKIEPGSFANLNNLISLNLADNLIKDLKTGTFKGLKSLQSLIAGKNALVELPTELISLKNLKFLDVAGNPLVCNCATLEVRDELVIKGVKISKRALCYGPSDLVGVSIMKPDTHRICELEKQDDEMQMDQPFMDNGSGLEGSGDDYDNEKDVEDYDYKMAKATTKKPVEEVETPVPGFGSTSLPEATPVSLEKSNTTGGEEIFLDSDENDKKTKSATATSVSMSKSTEDLLFVTEGSGDIDDEGSGLEGSGTGVPHIDWSQIQKETSDENSETPSDPISTTSSESLLDMLWGVFWTTAAPEERKDLDFEEEQFIHVTSEETPVEVIIPKEAVTEEVSVSLKEAALPPKTVDPKPTNESEKLTNSEEETSDELGDVSPARQSKKGMGSYVVLAALLAVLAGLIGFAAYKGDFCRSKRKRSDVENGTELKDMQKSLLETNNATQPKVASNGNTEISPLVTDKPDGNHEEDRTRPANGNTTTEEPTLRKVPSDNWDPVKPPRKSMNSADEKAATNGTDSNSGFPAYPEETPLHSTTHQGITRPPLSPSAQRVKITLQDNPDSVPKAPVLITRLKGGENLVKTP